ncbi:MAG: zinc-ribbon domain-containing protein [Candidatus Lokiarchaeota archaeon]|nr:zinc-ribbon domain-containing protein [Candidatus Lokiarchaeota archaeon]
MRIKTSNENLIKENKYKLTSCFVLILLAIIIVSNANPAYAVFSRTETEILDPQTGAVVNIVDSSTDDIISVEYEVISGTSIDVYLREGVTLLLFGAPSTYIKKDNDSFEGEWSHTVINDSDYSVIFLNEDSVLTCTVRYTIEVGSLFGNIFDYLYIIIIVIGVVAAVVLLIVRSIVKKRKSIEPEVKPEPKTQTKVKSESPAQTRVEPLHGVLTFCPECGTKLQEGAAFCIECGHQL